MFALVPLDLQVPWGNDKMDPGGYYAHSISVLFRGTLILGNPNLLKVLLAKLLNLCPRGKNYLYYILQENNIPFAPEGDTISIFQGCSAI